ncbi:hypothetical protein ABH922_002804 [Rhodococcus sp. 27YEA15]
MKGAAAIAATAGLVTAGTAWAIAWAVWRWATGHAVIARSDHYERRNF